MDIDRIYLDILTGKILSSIYLASMDITYWSVRSSSRRGGFGVKGVNGGIAMLTSCKHHFIRVHGNLVQIDLYL